MKTVNREEFVLWGRGILLDFENGKGVVVNERACEAAEVALLAGEKIALTLDNTIVSYMILKNDCLYETLE
jgi:hypothetical protein